MENKVEELLEQLKSAETLDEAEAIKAEIDGLKSENDNEEQEPENMENILAAMNADEPVKAAPAAPKTLGEFAAKNLDFAAMRAGSAKAAGTDYNFKAATDVHMSTPIEVVDRNVVDIARSLEIRSLFGAESISGTSLKYFVLGETEGAPTVVPEDGKTPGTGQKPQFHVPYAPATATLQKIAGWYYETDELIEDNEFLRSSIDARGLYALDKAVEGYLMSTLLATSGIQAVAEAPTADNIFGAMMSVKDATNFDADAIVINPVDYQTLRLAKDGGASGQYYGGGYFYGPYGNGEVAKQPGLWGLNTVITPAVEAGTVLVGAFKQGGSVITKAGEGARVEVVMGDHEDRTNNRVTVIVEERLALATRVPAAFVKIATA